VQAKLRRGRAPIRALRLARDPALGPVAALAALGVWWGGWASLVPAVKEDAGLTEGELGLAVLGVGVGALPAMLVAGPVGDRFGRRAIVLALVAFAGVGLLPGLADSQGQLFLALVLCGAASGALDVMVNGAISGLEAGGRRLMNLAHGLFSLGMLAGSVGVGIARSAGAGRLGILAALAAVQLGVAFLNRGGPQPRPAGPRGARRFDFSRRLLLLGSLCALAFAIEGGVEGWSALHLEQTLGAGPAVGGLGPGVFAAGMVAGRLSAQALGQHVSDRLLLGGAATVGGGGMALAALAPSAGVALLGFALAGLGMSVAAPTLFGLAGRGAGEGARATAIATVATIGYLALLLGPPLVGLVAELASLRAGLALLALLGFVLAAGSLALRPPART
jgi:MFS family permease